jgi:glyceraldehyde-3-phosphate dehydrogenase/erythrose-4-phosphate dehydrogenase
MRITLNVPHQRNAAQNIIPTPGRHGKATAWCCSELKGKMDGLAMRVPVPQGSVTDLAAELGREVTKGKVKAAFRTAAKEPPKGYLYYTGRPIVSLGYRGLPGPHRSSRLPKAQVRLARRGGAGGRSGRRRPGPGSRSWRRCG